MVLPSVGEGGHKSSTSTDIVCNPCNDKQQPSHSKAVAPTRSPHSMHINFQRVGQGVVLEVELWDRNRKGHSGARNGKGVGI